MDIIPDELLLQILEFVRNRKEDSLQSCQFVSRRFCNISRALYFQHVIIHDEASLQFLENTTTTMRYLLQALTIKLSSRHLAITDFELVKLIHGSTLHELSLDLASMDRQIDECVTTITTCNSSSRLPALQQMRLITPQEPFLTLTAFQSLKALEIRAPVITFSTACSYASLVRLHLTCRTIPWDPFKAFLERHKDLQHVQLHVILSLGGPEGSLITGVMELLRQHLDIERFVREAHVRADKQGGKFLQSICDQLSTVQDGTEMRNLVALFLGKYRTMEKIRIASELEQLQGSNQNLKFEVSTSWAKEDVIRSATKEQASLVIADKRWWFGIQ